MIPRDLILPEDLAAADPELAAEAAEVGAAEVALLIELGDPRECDCCTGRTRDRHCLDCHP